MRAGRRLPEGAVSLDDARRHAAAEIARLPERIRSIRPAVPGYPVEVSDGLLAYRDEVRREITGG